MRAQLAAKVRTAQSELTGYLRYVVLYIVHAVTRRDSLLVFGMGLWSLSTPLVHLDAVRFLPAALDAVAFQHQMPMVDTDITGESADGNPTLSANLGNGEVCGGI